MNSQNTVEVKKQIPNDLKYVFMNRRGIIFRGRIWLAGKLIPKNLSQFGRAWIAGIDVSLEKTPPKPNRAARRRKK